MLTSLHYISRLLLLFALIQLALPLRAEQVEGLYDVVVPVKAQSSRELSTATRAGLKKVLVRISGKASVIKQPAIASALGRAANFVRQYGYESRPGEEEGSEQMEVFIEFEQQLIDQLLRSSGQPMWSSNRPSMLVWLAIEDEAGRRFATVDQDADIIDAIKDHARRRGLAIKLPLLDLEDMVAMSVGDLWQLNVRKSNTAVERYRTDALLLGRVTRLTNGEWLGRWSYENNGQQATFEGEAVSADDYISSAIDQIADWMADQYAVVPVSMANEGIILRVTGVHSFVDYARTIRYLESVAAIRHANTVFVEGDEIIVQLLADGIKSQLQQALALGKQLEPNVNKFYFGEYPLDLDYHWPHSAFKPVDAKAINTNKELGVTQ